MAVKNPSVKVPEKPSTQTDEEKLRIVFKKICAFCAYYSNTTKAINSGSGEARHAADLLRRFAAYLSRLLPGVEEAGLSIHVSKAMPSMPRVPWVAILPKGKFVSSSISVAVCFGRAGNGAVVGLMQPSSRGMIGTAFPVIRSGGKGCVVDVDGNNPGTKYNDRFVNPEEFLGADIAIHQLVKHILESVKLMRQLS